MLQRSFPNQINRPSQPISEPVRSALVSRTKFQSRPTSIRHFHCLLLSPPKQSRVRPSLYAEEGHVSAAAACVY